MVTGDKSTRRGGLRPANTCGIFIFEVQTLDFADYISRHAVHRASRFACRRSDGKNAARSTRVSRRVDGSRVARHDTVRSEELPRDIQYGRPGSLLRHWTRAAPGSAFRRASLAYLAGNSELVDLQEFVKTRRPRA